MVLKLYGVPYSGNVRRAVCVIAECGLFDGDDFVFVEIQREDLKKSPHIDKSPFGLMPYLEDTDTGKVIIESRAIARYIALKTQSPLLVLPPAAGADDTHLDKWLRFEEACSIESTVWDPPITMLAKELKMKKDRFGLDPDERIVDEFRPLLESRLKFLDELLGKQKYLAGEEITLADLFCLPYGERMDQGGLKVLSDGTYPNIARWWTSLTSRESWIKANSLQK